ncbi:PRELI domain-containing protein 1, mitochondrial [Lingula anatina]|uniref:PRELI domain-containing protein 1, mitochondrial n=1 Tax=Lingula anatina TaxID=7574 RepID=A0A1S3JQM4_LINAN|nr:PRELI domain-containing protein 1, mitochondrial [Lingula anatina]XP_013412274.1 PRELI domain-containing protein 1, mitochondrial [Lingula anatina]|eukprot:XP_013412273.1 PRELI domain-containing protein 1, mitochondrial [Lingula anatina]
MKYTSLTATFPYAWEDFIKAFWKMFPNPYNPQVVVEDVLERNIQDGKLYTKRILVKSFANFPKWVETLLRGATRTCVIEESIVDLENRTFVTYVRNITQTAVVVEERCTYKPSTTSNSETECDRQAWATSGLWGVAAALESVAMREFVKDTELTNKGVLLTLQTLHGRN